MNINTFVFVCIILHPKISTNWKEKSRGHKTIISKCRRTRWSRDHFCHQNRFTLFETMLSINIDHNMKLPLKLNAVNLSIQLDLWQEDNWMRMGDNFPGMYCLTLLLFWCSVIFRKFHPGLEKWNHFTPQMPSGNKVNIQVQHYIPNPQKGIPSVLLIY